jgi:hypothetical protein
MLGTLSVEQVDRCEGYRLHFRGNYQNHLETVESCHCKAIRAPSPSRALNRVWILHDYGGWCNEHKHVGAKQTHKPSHGKCAERNTMISKEEKRAHGPESN